MAKKPEPYRYGKHPHPTNWHQTVDALQSLNRGKVKSKKPSPLVERLAAIEKLLQEK